MSQDAKYRERKYQIHLRSALLEFEENFRDEPKDAAYHMTQAVSRYDVDHPDYDRVIWCMEPIRILIMGSPVAIFEDCIASCRTRLNIPPEFLGTLAGEMTFIVYRNPESGRRNPNV